MTPLAAFPLLGLLLAGPVAAAAGAPGPERAAEAVARGDLEEARAALEDVGGPAEIECRLGDILRELARPEEAVEAYERALDSEPTLVAAAEGLGLALLDLGRPGHALAPLEAASRAGSVRALGALGRARLETGDPIGALAEWRLAESLDAGEESEKAAELYEYFRNRHAQELQERREKGWEAHRRGRYEEAATLLLGWSLAEGRGVEEALAGGRSALAAGLPPERALRGFLLVEELDATPAQRSEALAGRGAARLRLGQTDRAAELFAEAARLQEDNPEALIGAAVSLARLGREEEAAPYLRRAMRASEEQGREDLLDFARNEEVLSGRAADSRLREIVSSR